MEHRASSRPVLVAVNADSVSVGVGGNVGIVGGPVVAPPCGLLQESNERAMHMTAQTRTNIARDVISTVSADTPCRVTIRPRSRSLIADELFTKWPHASASL